MKIIIFIIFLLIGCETVHKGAQEVGKPIGQATKAVGGVTEGAAEGYSNKQTENPYNR
jgi:Sec-independent protein translocase protein TatA